MYSRIVLQSLCASVLLLLHVFVHSNPIVNEIGGKQSWIIDGIMSAVRNDPTLRKMESASSEHAFIKLDAPRNQAEIQANGTITVEGDSSMQLFNQMDINRARFNPDYFLESVGNEAARPVEVSPAAGQPYFMFISSPLLKNQSLRKSIFSNIGKRRIKRHHPNPLQNVLGELQNYALVPIKSSNGQIRYILLKNPKFVIGNPADIGQSGQPAPAIIQLNSNFAAPMPRGSIRYTPKLPQRPVTPPTFRRNTLSRFLRRPVPVAMPIDSVFSTQNTERSRSERGSSKTKITNSLFNSPGRAGTTPPSDIPLTWQAIRRNFNKNSNRPKLVENSKDISRIQSSSKSVSTDIVASSASNLTQDSNVIKAATAESVVAKTVSNSTNADQATSKDIKITKVGDGHKIEQTEITETVVDVEQNTTSVKTDAAASKVVASANTIDGTRAHIHDGDASSANTSAAAVSTAEKQSKVVKKTKKTTTILLKSGSATHSGKAEISEIKQTVEEEVHHNTSETIAAETAATANVSVTADVHASHDNTHASHGQFHTAPGHSHVPHDAHGPIKTKSAAASEAKTAINSTSTSVKTKSIKQTVLTKNVSGTGGVGTGPSSGIVSDTGGSVGGTNGGFNVQHVEHVVQETEHKTHDTSQSSKQNSASTKLHPH